MTRYIVDTADDIVDGDYSAGHLSLREAVALANAHPGFDRIVFAASLRNAEIVLQQGDLFVTDPLLIKGDMTGDGRADVTLSGGGLSRIFSVVGDGAQLSLDSLTLAHGFAYSGTGGAIWASDVGGLSISRTTILDCQAAGGGGAIYARGTSLDLMQSLIRDNVSGGNGGGIYVVGGIATLVDSTLDGNRAAVYGGGLSIADGADVTVANCTITANRAWITASPTDGGGGIDIFNASLVLANSVVAGNLSGTGSAASDLHGDPATTQSCFIGGDPHLAPLLDNGGAVLTRSPLDGSPLIDAGDGTLLPLDVLDIDGDGITDEPLPLDGRFGLRLVGGAIDIGAVEKVTDEWIRGTDGPDLIDGGSGNDVLAGLGGTDTVIGGAGADVMTGGGGNDTLSYLGSPSGVTVDLATGLAAFGDAAGDVFSGFENLRGSGFADVLTGDDGRNRVVGAGGADLIAGQGGRDLLVGGGGADTFVFAAIADSPAGAGRDLILDFAPAAGDVIDLSAIDAVAGGSDDAFHLTGNGGADPFTATAGELRISFGASRTFIRCDVDGDGHADFEIALNGILTLGPDDILL